MSCVRGRRIACFVVLGTDVIFYYTGAVCVRLNQLKTVFMGVVANTDKHQDLNVYRRVETSRTDLTFPNRRIRLQSRRVIRILVHTYCRKRRHCFPFLFIPKRIMLRIVILYCNQRFPIDFQQMFCGRKYADKGCFFQTHLRLFFRVSIYNK